MSTATLIEQYVAVLFLLIIAGAQGELFRLDFSGTAFGILTSSLLGHEVS